MSGADGTSAPFRPSVVTRVGTSFVVLDDLQPRALVVAADEDIEDDRAPSRRLLSWTDWPAPTELRWPWRTVVAQGDVASVIDGPGTSPVGLRADPALGVVLADVAGEVPSGSDRRVARSRVSWSREIAAAGGGVWEVATTVSGLRLDARVSRRPAAGPVSSWSLGRGAVVGAAAHGDVLAVTVRRADKRPWRFRPRSDIALLSPARPDPCWIDLPSEAELRGTAWKPAPVDEGAVAAVVRAAEGAAEVVARDGGEAAVSVTTERVGELALPVVTMSFTHPLRPGPRCVRRDEPVSELGLATGGLAGMTVILEEDLMTGFLPDAEESRDGVLAV